MLTKFHVILNTLFVNAVNSKYNFCDDTRVTFLAVVSCFVSASLGKLLNVRRTAAKLLIEEKQLPVLCSSKSR